MTKKAHELLSTPKSLMTSTTSDAVSVAKRIQRWADQLPAGDNDATVSWLCLRDSGGDVFVGCWVCEAAATSSTRPSPWANHTVTSHNVKFGNVTRHAQSWQHRQAVQQVCGVTPSSSQKLAPDHNEFLDVLKLRSQGASQRGSVTSARGREKVLRMTWCLGEAIREDERAFMKSADVIALHQDARSNALLVEYVAVNNKLERRRGVLGVIRDYGTSSDETCAALLTIIDDFCTPRLHPPRKTSQSDPTCDVDLKKHILNVVEMFDTDAASDETRVARLLQGRIFDVPHDQRAPVMPNLKMVLHDRCHAVTRLGALRLIAYTGLCSVRVAFALDA